MGLPRLLLSLVGLLFVSHPFLGWGQQKLPLSEQDYGLWSTLRVEQFSQSGDWVSYLNDYEVREDTLFVRHVRNKKVFAFAGGNDGRFIGGHFFGCLLPNETFELTDLQLGSRQVFYGITAYYILSGGSSILLSGITDAVPYLEIRTVAGKYVKRTNQVTAIKVSENGEKVFYSYNDSGANRACVYLAEKGTDHLVAESLAGQLFVNPSWNRDGTAVAFYGQNADGTLFGANVYGVSSQQLFTLDSKRTAGFPKDKVLLEGYNPIVVSDDGKLVFVRLRDTVKTVHEDDAVQVWLGNDKRIYPQREQFARGYLGRSLGVWQAEKNTFALITNDSLPKVMLCGSQRYAVTYNPMALNHEQFKYEGDVDFYLTDLATGVRKLWLENHTTAMIQTIASPGGKYIVYNKGADWYAYDLEFEKHRKLDPIGRDTASRDPYGDSDGLRIVGFSPDDRSVYISDGTDIWESDPLTQKSTRLTNGVEKKIRYSFYRNEASFYNANDFDGFTGIEIDPEAGFYLYGRDFDYRRSGYFLWNNNEGLKTIVYREGLLDEFRASKDGDYIYRTQEYAKPPSLVIGGIGKKPTVFYNSNPQHHRFMWGVQEQVIYQTSKGETLSGILHYPAGYVKGRHYPMVVLIYQLLSNDYHRYVNPSMYDGMGFNVTDFTLRGYLVLLPDITYERGNPGLSALDCVTSAVAVVAAKGCLKTDSVGLIGHSFGGYETNFIITQTGRFAAAVSGAGISDTPRSYLSYGSNLFSDNIWRYEYHQMRMGTSLFENLEGYRRNSPIEYVKQVTTPLLSWTGGADPTVDPEQTLSFYLALRRLGKKQIMLLYPKEPHGLMEPKNQTDLRWRVRDWFDHYLKGEKKDWITEGTL